MIRLATSVAAEAQARSVAASGLCPLSDSRLRQAPHHGTTCDDGSNGPIRLGRDGHSATIKIG